MISERMQRQIDALLNQAEVAVATQDWGAVAGAARAVLAIDSENADARGFLAMSRANGVTSVAGGAAATPADAPTESARPATEQPASFAGGRYEVRRFLGEGGKKRVFLAHDTRLDRDVAFALIKTEGLDDVARERITREAQTMGRLGAHPNVVTVLDMGEHEGQPFVVIELLGGGDIEGLLDDAAGPLPLERSLKIALDVCRGLDFIHSKGIVHRDLKPGNVWLTADGVAKIGDYGLAMSADRTRLTLEGTMVGTVGYMPPEQALGGDITARSDLYSLGAMLYEMVTGGVPFRGDRITDIISQHINVAPERPSARGTQIPLALEELILQLLDKEPARRPESAADVARALEAIDPLDLVDALDPDYLARRAQGVFVGRSRELEELRRRFDEVVVGQSRIVVLVGQPGIGKTRLAQELEGYARSRGARVFWGRAPEGGGAPEYWLFHQMLRRFLEQAPVDVARELLGEDAVQLARIAPEIRERLRGLPEPAETSEFALFEAIRAFVRRMAESQPLVLVLDDLHWADTGSLSLLQHASRDLQRARVLILGTYRDTETSRTHPLSQALATLNREPNFFRLAVRSLGRDEVSSYLEAAAGFEPTREQLDVFMRETDGNPFFLSEIVSGMLERRTLDDRTYDLDIPDGMREALARRVNALSEDAVDLLKLAAVIGYEFDFATLSVVSELDDDRELELIEEALGERVIAEGERAGGYRFVYQPMQRLLLDEISSTRQLRLHGQVAELLEVSYGASAEQHASALAPHFAASAQLNPAHLDRAVRFSVLAAAATESAREWDAVRRFARQALDLGAEVLTSDQRIGLLVALARAELNTGDQQAAVESVREALALCRAAGRPKRAGEVVLELRRVWSGPTPERDGLIASALEALGDGSSDLAARLLAWRSEGDYSQAGDAAALEASRLAPPDEDDQARLILSSRDAAGLLRQGQFEAGFEAAERSLHAMRSAGDEAGWLLLARVVADAAFWAGDMSKAEALWAEIGSESERRRDTGTFEWALGRRASIDLLRGDWADLDQVISRPLRVGNSIDRSTVTRLLETRGQPARARTIPSESGRS